MATKEQVPSIFDLPFEVLIGICEFLNEADRLNFCTAIPEWSSVFSVEIGHQVLHKHISHFTWFDKQLCDALWSENSAAAHLTALRANLYYNERNRLWFRRSFARASIRALEPLSCLIISPTASVKPLSVGDLHGLEPYVHVVDRSSDVFVPLQNQHQKAILRLPIIKRRGLTEVFVKTSFLLSCIGSQFPGISSYSEDLLAADKTKIRRANCILYFVEYQKCTDKQNIWITLKTIARSLLMNQTLIVVVAVNAKEGKVHAVKRIEEFYRDLGSSKDSPLAAISTNWRLWCLYEGKFGYLNWVEIFRWACLVAIWKRNEYYQGGGRK